MKKLLILLAMTGCPSTPIDTETSTPTDTPPPTVIASCAAAYEALEALDVVAANAAFVACIADDPTNVNHVFGKALTDLILLVDGPAAQNLLSDCGESAVIGPSIYGSGGLLEIYEGDRTDHVAALTMAHVVDGTSNPIAFLENADYVESINYVGRTWIDLNDDFRGLESLTISLHHNDVYQDQSNVPLTDGLVINVNQMFGQPYFNIPCGQPGSTCDGVFTPSPASGTITVVQAGLFAGDTLQLELNFELPTTCTACTTASLHVSGSFTDTVLDESDLIEAVPLGAAFRDNRCATTDTCESDTELLSALVDICPNVTAGATYTETLAMADQLEAIAADFATAGASDTLAFEFPDGGLFFILQPVPMNQTDALMFAAGVQSLAGVMGLATGFDSLNPSTTLGSLAGHYQNGEWDGATCQQIDYWGVSSSGWVSALAPLGEHNSNADFPAAQANLLLGMQHLKAAGGSNPLGGGVFDFGETPGYRDAVVSDVDVVIASLEGTDGNLATAPAWSINLATFFFDVPDVADLVAEAGITDVLTTETANSCETYVFVPEEAADWLLENNRGFPVTESRIDSEQVPTLFDEDAYPPLEDNDGFPRFIHPRAKTILQEILWGEGD